LLVAVLLCKKRCVELEGCGGAGPGECAVRADVDLVERLLEVGLPGAHDTGRTPGARKVSGWPKRCRLAHAFLWEHG
jgi:hypothetical protein